MINANEGRGSMRRKLMNGRGIEEEYGGQETNSPVIYFEARVPTVKTEARITCRPQQHRKQD
jgi:hypothetical protein